MTYSLQYRFGTGTNQDKTFLQQLQIDLDGIITGLNAIGTPANTALGGLTPAADKVPYFTSTTAATTADFTAAGRALVAGATVAAQQATLGQGLVLLQTQVGAGASTPVLDFVNGIGGTVLDDTYDRYRLVIDTLRPATDDVALFIRVGTGGGPTYAATNYNTQAFVQDAGVQITLNTAAGNAMQFTRTAGAVNAVGNGAAESISMVVEFTNPESTTQYCIFSMMGGGYADPDGLLIALLGGASYNTFGGALEAITGVRVMFNTGDITSGRVSLYAYRK